MTPDFQTRLASRGAAIARTPWVPFLVLGAMMVTSAIVFLHAGRGTTFFQDEWNFVESRYAWNLDAFLEPHNEHFSLVPVAVYKVLFSTVGLDDYRLYRAAGILFHLACVGMIFLFARRRTGDWLALALVTPLLFLATSWIDIAWPFQIGFLASITFGVAALMAAERGTRGGDLVTCGLLILSLSSSGTGVPFTLAVFLQILMRAEWRARLWAVAVPIALYGLWYLVYGHSAARLSNLDDVPAYVATAAAGAAGSLSGLGPEWGRIFIVLLAIGVGYAWLRSPRRLDPLVAIAVIGITFWVLTALARAQLGEPAAIRYLYPGAVFLVLVLAELMRRADVLAWDSGRVVAVCCAGVVAAVANHPSLSGVAIFRSESADARAATAAIEIAAPVAAPNVTVDDFQPQIRPPAYLAAVKALDSSPAYSQRELEAAAPGVRMAADDALLRIYQPRPEPPPVGGRPGQAPAVVAVSGAAQRVRGSCVTFTRSGGDVRADVTLPAAGVTISPVGAGTAVEVRLRRFADGFGAAPIGTTQDRAVIRMPADASRRPWQLEVRRRGSLRVCGLAPASP